MRIRLDVLRNRIEYCPDPGIYTIVDEWIEQFKTDFLDSKELPESLNPK